MSLVPAPKSGGEGGTLCSGALTAPQQKTEGACITQSFIYHSLLLLCIRGPFGRVTTPHLVDVMTTASYNKGLVATTQVEETA